MHDRPPPDDLRDGERGVVDPVDAELDRHAAEVRQRPGPAVARWLAWIISAASELIRCPHRRPAPGAAVASRTPKASTAPRRVDGRLGVGTAEDAEDERRMGRRAVDADARPPLHPHGDVRWSHQTGCRSRRTSRPPGDGHAPGLDRVAREAASSRRPNRRRRRPVVARAPWLRTFTHGDSERSGRGCGAPLVLGFCMSAGSPPSGSVAAPGPPGTMPQCRPSRAHWQASRRPGHRNPRTLRVPWRPSRRRGAPKVRGEPRAMPIEPYIDAHSHIWTPDVAHYPLAPGFKVEDMKPAVVHRRGAAGASAGPRGRPGQPDPDELLRVRQLLHARHDQAVPRPLRRHGDRRPARRRPRPRDARRCGPKGVRAFRIAAELQQAARRRDGSSRPATRAMFAAAAADRPGPELPDRPRRLRRGRPDVPPVPRHPGHHRPPRPDRRPTARSATPTSTPSAPWPGTPSSWSRSGAFYALGKKTPPYLDLAPLIRRVVAGLRRRSLHVGERLPVPGRLATRTPTASPWSATGSTS